MTAPRQYPRYNSYFFVPGIPAPQGSKRHVGHGIMIESSKNLPAWRQSVAAHSRNAMSGRQPLTGAVKISLVFKLPRPKSLPKSSHPWAIKRPDIDKLSRAVLDGITGTIVKDDSQIVVLHSRKYISDDDPSTGVHISVWELS